MDFLTTTGLAALALILLKWAAQLGLNALNQRHVRARAGNVPEPYREMIDEPAYRKSVDYTLTQARFGRIDTSWSTVVLILVLFSGLLPWTYEAFQSGWGASVWAMAGFLFAVGILLAIPGLPLDWYDQFRIEERFGFNNTTQKLWWLDRLKGLLLALALGYPLLALILKLVEWSGSLWWFWAWLCVVAFQWIMMILAPVLIMPLFNKFTPLEDGELKDALNELAHRTGFQAQSIQVMDGSKRSKHSNAFFTGFGRFRKIVLFDTLIEQLTPDELESVLAHEIGHYKKKHVWKMVLLSTLSLFAGFWIIAWLANQEWFYRAFGFEPGGGIIPALLLFSLLSGAITFWFTPLGNLLSRKWEYEADRFAKQAVGQPDPLIHALRKLNEKNLGNLTPHPLYSGFYYSHPTLVEREAALRKGV